MNAIRVLLFKSFARYLRNKTAVALTFIVPIAMIIIFGQVFGINRRDSGPNRLPLGVVDASGNPAAQKLVAALRREEAFRVITEVPNGTGGTRPLTEADLAPMIRQHEFRFALLIPADVIPASGFGLHLKIFSDPLNEIETQTVNGLLQKTIFTNVPELLGQSLQANARRYLGEPRLNAFNAAMAGAVASSFGGDKEQIQRAIEQGDFGFSVLRRDAAKNSTAAPDANDDAIAAKRTDAFSRFVKLDTVQVVGAAVKSPAATRVVGGWAIMFLMFALNGAATSLFEEKKAGIFQRLLAAPVTRADILWSRFIFGIVLGLVQLVTVFLVGSLLYGIEVFPHFGNLAVICTAAAAACTALGMFLAAVSSSPEAAQGLATFVILTMSACGGAWFPVSFMPGFMQQVAKFTLTYWAMDGFAQVLWAGNSLREILPTTGVLLGIAAGLMGLAVWLFNRNHLFD